MDVRTTPLPGAPCPACGSYLDIASGIGRPKEGDITLCAYCYVFLTFAAEGYNILSNAEWLALEVEHRKLLSQVRERFIKYKEACDRSSI
jgi:hypothetical protein